MQKNLLRVSKADYLPIRKSTLYKWHHLGKFSQIFIKLSGMLFVDLDEFNKLLDSNRSKA
jgi:hypothetical protein